MLEKQRELNNKLSIALQEKKRDFQNIEALLNAGANPNLLVNESVTLLMWEVWRRGSAKIIKLLLAAQANVNSRDASGLSALALIVIKGRFDLVQILVNEGAELNVCDDEGNSILDLAYQNNRPKIAKYLEELGARSGYDIKELQIGVKAKKIVFNKKI